MNIRRLLNSSIDQLARLPSRIPDYVKQYEIEKGVLPMDTLRTLRNLAILKDEPDLLEIVMLAGCDCEPAKDGWNPLHSADDYNSAAMVHTLLKAGASMPDPTRVFRAAADGSFNRMLAWLSFIPDPNITDEEGRYAWDIYHRTRNFGQLSMAVQQEQDRQLEKVLLERSLPQASIAQKSTLRL